MSKSKRNWTMVRMRERILKTAKRQASKQNRSVANYLETLVLEDVHKGMHSQDKNRLRSFFGL